MKTTRNTAQSGVILLFLLFIMVLAGIIYIVYHAYTVRRNAPAKNTSAYHYYLS